MSFIGVPFVPYEAGAPAFSPLDLSPICWWDPSDLSTLFQDAAGSTPVTTDNDPIRRINDKSGNGNNLTAPSDSARPLYKTSGGLHWLLADGVDDALSGYTPATTDDKEWVCAVEWPTPTNGHSLMRMQHSTGTPYLILGLGNATPLLNIASNLDPFGASGPVFTSFTGAVVLGMSRDRNVTTTGAQAWKDGVVVNQATTSNTQIGGAPFGLINRDHATPVSFGGKVYGALCFDRILGSTERANLVTWLGNKIGRSL